MSKRRKSRRRRSASIVRTIAAEMPADTALEDVLASRSLARMLKYAGVTDDPERRQRYLALVGCQVHDELLSCNLVQGKNLVSEMSSGLSKVASAPGFEIAVQIQRFATSPSSRIDFDVKEARQRVRDYKEVGVSSISSIVPVDLPLTNDRSQFVVEPQVRSLLFGPSISGPMEQRRRTFRKSALSNDGATTLEWIDAEDGESLRQAVEDVIAPPLVGGSSGKDAAEAAGIEWWMKPKRAAHRAWVILQVYSMLSMKKRYKAQGHGKSLLEPALSGAYERYRQLRSIDGPAIHRDAVLHFWAEEIRLLGLDDYRLPLVRTR